MAFKLTKDESSQRGDLVAKLEEAESEIDEAIKAANEAIDALLIPLNEKITAYNEVLTETKDYIETVTSRWQEEFEEKSEKWQEGEKGVAASAMITAWTDLDFEELEELEISPIEEADLGHAEELANTPDEI